jgi:type I restriction enzyme, S subunit
MSESVPGGWVSTKLDSCLVKLISGQSPNRKEHPARQGKYGILKTTAIDWGIYKPEENQEILDDFPPNENHLVGVGDILITKAGPDHRVGVIAFVKKTLPKVLVSGKMTLLKTNAVVDARFLAYTLSTPFSQKYLKNNTTGMAMSQTNFTHEALLCVPVLLPNIKAEQQKIASILTSVDTVIEKTEAQINKLKDLKKAMMQELLTKGIGHTEFKDSPVGRIPKGWKVMQISVSNIEVLDGDRGNEYPKEKDFMNSGFCLFLSAKNVTKNGFKFEECAFISEDKDGKLRKGRLAKEDIVITTRGTVGNMAYFDESIPYRVMRINSGMAIFRNEDKLISTKYFYQLLQSLVIKQQLELLTFGSAQPQLTIGVINSLFIPIPSLAEQNKIVSIFTSADNNIDGKQNILSHTKSLKKALMQDLLTGKVRVKV